VPHSDPEKRRAYQRDYIKRTWLRHLEHSKEAMRRWRANNPEARLARDQEALSVAQHRLEAGTSFRSDVLRAGVELSSAKEALLAAQAECAAGFAQSRQKVRRLHNNLGDLLND